MMFVITHKTKDYGMKYVVREHTASYPVAIPLAVCNTLKEARHVIKLVAPTLERLPRTEHDDTVIVESWAPPDIVQAALISEPPPNCSRPPSSR